MTPFAIVGADGSIISRGRASDDDVTSQVVPDGATLQILTEDQDATLRIGGWKWQDGAPVPDVPPVDLEALRASTLVAIDAAAEMARLRYLTPGAGQAAEYLKTEAEARAYTGTGTAADWPWLAAEQQALAAVGQTVGLDQVAAAVIAQADAWNAAGATIKELRRAAKLKVEAATTEADIRAAAIITWPAP